MEITENARVRQSIKISLEHKFIRQKAEFLDQVEKQMQIMQQKMSSQIQEDHQHIINNNIKISFLEKKNEEKLKIISEQELLIRNYATTIASLQSQVAIQPKIDEEEYENSQKQKNIIEELKMKNLRLSLKLSKLLSYFIEFKFYNREYAQKIESDECSCDEIKKPKLLQHQDLLDQIKNNEKYYHTLIKQQLLNDEIDVLKKENIGMRKKLIRHNLTETLDLESQQKTINVMGEQIEDQKRYIEGLINQIKQRNRTTTCKTLNDILIKKRILSVDCDEPVFDVNKSGRKVIAERQKLSTLSFVAQKRLHTQNY